MSWENKIKKNVNVDIENIISAINEKIATDADNNSDKVPHLRRAVNALELAKRA